MFSTLHISIDAQILLSPPARSRPTYITRNVKYESNYVIPVEVLSAYANGLD